ncbi:MAG TPA: Holliday junction branch migration protein RuvA [Candidatus Saccharimonadales bacterium]|nr:Holliday junction branch migration protein RuvA [Candidatus Saccharimonadales bacterium]
MIATLTGTVAEKLAELLVLDVGGIGYGLLVNNEDLGQLTLGKDAKVYVHEHIRENSYDLYGFSRLDSLRLFEQLLDVNGVGPKMALNILGVANADAVRAAIASGDTKFIQAASGVGKRVAERIIVELKDKVGLISSEGATDFLQGPAMQDEAVQALVALGFTAQDATLALQKVDKKLPTEERIKQALKETSR